MARVGEALCRIGIAGAEGESIQPGEPLVGRNGGDAIAEAWEAIGGDAGGHFVDDKSGGVDVGPGIHAPVGRHVAERADARGGETGGREKSEVAEFQFAADKEAVGRFDIAMNHAGFVQAGERGQELAGASFAVGRLQGAGGEHVVEGGGAIVGIGRIGMAGEVVGEFHDVEEVIGRFADVMDGKEIGVTVAAIGLEAGEGGDLAAGGVAITDAGTGNDFDGPGASGRAIDGEPDLAESAFTDGANEIEVGDLWRITLAHGDLPG